MKYLAAVCCLVVATASAQVAKTKSSCSHTPINCGTKYGDAGWSLDQKTCAQLKADADTTYRKCKEAEASEPSPDAKKAVQDQMRKQQIRDERDAQATAGTDVGILKEQARPVTEIFNDALAEQMRDVYTTGEVKSVEEIGMKKVEAVRAEAEAALRASTPNSTAGPSQVCSDGRSYCGDEPEHPALTPKEVFQQGEMRQYNAQMEKYTKALAKKEEAKKAQEQAIRDAAAKQQVHSYSSHDRGSSSPSISSSDCHAGDKVCR